MANKYVFNRDSITVNGRQFPARYEVMEKDADRGSYYTVVIFATVDSGAEVAIEVPASDRQHGAALKAAQIAAGLPGMDSGSAPADASQGAADAAQVVQQAQAADASQIAPEGAQGAADAAQVVQQAPAADAGQVAPEGAQIEKEAQTMKSNIKRYAVYFSDYPTQAATFEAANKREAEKAARQYIKAWNLTAKIDRVERLDSDSAPAQARQDSAPADAAQVVQQATQAPEAAADAAQVARDAGQVVQQAQAADASQTAPAGPSEGAQVAPAQELPGRIAARRQQARQRREAANRGETAPAADAAQAAAAVDNTSNNPVMDSATAQAADVSQVVQQATQAPEAAADAAQVAPDAAPEEPSPDVLEEIGGTAPAQTQAADASQVVPDAKAAHGPIPEKTFKNEVIAGKGWSIVFDAGCNRTRVILANPIKKAARPIVEAAGFYYSRTLDSWNKKLTFRAHRAAQALADNLRAVLG